MKDLSALYDDVASLLQWLVDDSAVRVAYNIRDVYNGTRGVPEIPKNSPG